MEMGTSHGVVWHSVVQKMTDPMTDHYFDESTTHNLKLNENLKLRKSVCQVSMKGDYIVMSRSLHRLNRKFNDILTKHL